MKFIKLNPDSLDAISNKEFEIMPFITVLGNSWKGLVCACVFGALVGLTAFFTLSKYSAEIYMNDLPFKSVGEWQKIQYSLPGLAGKMVEEEKVPGEQIKLYRAMSSLDWWKKNTSMIFDAVKNDYKNLILPIENTNTTFLGILISASAPSYIEVMQSSKSEVSFVVNGSIYLMLRDWFIDKKAKVSLSRSTLDFEVEKNTTELIYLSEKLKHLESLAKQHPDDQKSSYQISDYSESSTKYLPVTTQIIGVKRDIYEKKKP